MKVLSLFTGAGGLDLGLEAAGFRTAACVEVDRQCVQTLKHNRPRWRVLEGKDGPVPIEQVSSDELLAVARLAVGEASLLVGGPPCQPFSKAGFWATGDSRRLADPRAQTLVEYLRVLEDAQPEAYLLENVPGIGFDRKSEGLDFLKRRIDRINRRVGTSYTFEVRQLNAADYGVPQLRERVFVVGHRGGRDFDFPEPTHGPVEELFRQPYRTAWDAIGDLEGDPDPELRPTGKWARLLPSIPEGQNYLWHTGRNSVAGSMELFGWRTRYWSFLLKLAKRLPSWTIQAQPGPATGPFHWKSRRLSVRELARLQTFPDDYEVVGSLRVSQRQLGNAVPAALAEVLGKEIRAQLLDGRGYRKLKLIPERADECPKPERRARVAKQYRELVAMYEEHPGTGRGARAARRSA